MQANALQAQLIDARDDLALWSVYADALQSAGDPRGALVTIMLERERTPSHRLLTAELSYRREHLAQLLPICLRRHADAIGWRRGFAFELPIPTLAVLEHVIADPAMAFVEAVRIELVVRELPEWLALLAEVEVPWRRVRVELTGADEEEQLDLAPLLARFPALEQLDIVFSAYNEGRTAWANAALSRLRRLTIDNCAAVTGLDEAQLPALEELRLIGTTVASEELTESELWTQLRRVVLGDQIEIPERRDEAPVIVRHARDDDDDYDRQEAFIAIRQLVDATLVEDLARGLAGLRKLVVSTGHAEGPEPFTVVRLHGSGAADLLPYGLAVLLEKHLPPKTPIVMFHENRGTARVFAFGDRPLRHTDARSGALIRNMFDLVIGRDVGAGVLDTLVDALATAQQTTVIGAGGEVELLTDIDPDGLGPLHDPDDYEDDVPEAALDLYTQEADEEVSPEAIESPVLGDEVVELLDDELVPPDDSEDEEDDDNDEETGEGRDAWVRLLAQWSQRVEDPDDELAERFPDPELQWTQPPDLETEPAAAACTVCEQVTALLRSCTSCGDPHCATCALEDEDHNVWCRSCLDTAASLG